MTGYVADLSWKSGVRAIEKLDRLRSTMAVNVLSEGHLWESRDRLPFTVWPMGSLVAQNIYAWIILELSFREHFPLSPLTTLVWMVTEYGPLKKDWVPLVEILRLQIIKLRGLLFNLISNITSFPISIPRIAAVDDFESPQTFTDVVIWKSYFIQQV